MTTEPRLPGYLTEVEASHISTVAMPGAVVISLTRDIANERRAGCRSRCMMVELSISEAVQFWQMLGEDIRNAGVMAQQPPHVDAVVNL